MATSRWREAGSRLFSSSDEDVKGLIDPRAVSFTAAGGGLAPPHRDLVVTGREPRRLEQEEVDELLRVFAG